MYRENTIEKLKKELERDLNIPYEEFEKLDFDQQQKLIKKHNSNNKSDKVTVMVGSGVHSFFRTVKRGELVMVGSGEHSCFIRAGITPEDKRKELDNKLDQIIDSKQKSFVKRLKRKFKRQIKGKATYEEKYLICLPW